jgi:hypothetical protein
MMRWNLSKRLDVTVIGPDKGVLRGWYLGYVGTTLEYNSLFIRKNVKSLDRCQNNTHNHNGTTPRAVCQIHIRGNIFNVLDKSAMEANRRSSIFLELPQ